MTANWSRCQMTELPVNFRKQLVKQHNVNYLVIKSVATDEAWNIASLAIGNACRLGSALAILEHRLLKHIKC
jgi:hypothetical protein